MSEAGWLFRQGELILGPSTAAQITEKIYAGELDGKSEVSSVGSGTFRRLETVELFRVPLAKAAAKHRVDQHAAQVHQKGKQKALIVLLVTLGVAVGLGTVTIVIGKYLAVHGGSGDDQPGEILMTAPTIGRARAQGEDELFDYAVGSSPKRPTGSRPATPRTQNPGGAQTPAGDDPDGMQLGQADQAAVNDVVTRNKKSLNPCLFAAVPREQAVKIPIEFSIGNDGKVQRVWVDHNDYKTGALPECLLKELQKWPFKPQPGGALSVNLSFNVPKRPN